jgi:hypothetical protein
MPGRGEERWVAEVRAEMVANVWKVVAAEGDQVEDGDTLVILESMKMEIPVLVEEAGRSVARLATVTGQALTTAVSRREGLQLARNEDARIAALRAQVDEDAEKARKALVLGEHKFEESSAAHANLERDLQAEMARREAVRDEWTAATDGAARSAADARDAQAEAAECDNLIEEARERLTELANAER